MKIKGLNFDIIWKDKLKNFQLIEEQLDKENADLFLLPEMFSTGFSMDASEISDKNKESVIFLKEMALKKNAAICKAIHMI